MRKTSTYLKIYKAISSIDKETLEQRKQITYDLFSDKKHADLIDFLQPNHLRRYIQPIPSTSTTSIEIHTIVDVPKVIYYAFLETVYGRLLIANTEQGICYVSFKEKDDLKNLQEYFPNSAIEEHETPMQKAAANYINNPIKTNLKLHLKGTTFQMEVWRQLCKIPSGQVSTYKHIAEAMHKPKASIAVGAAVGKNPVALLIPCHRVIRSNGVWQGFRWGNKSKASLLSYELF